MDICSIDITMVVLRTSQRHLFIVMDSNHGKRLTHGMLVKTSDRILMSHLLQLQHTSLQILPEATSILVDTFKAIVSHGKCDAISFKRCSFSGKKEL